jgi:hypothetical protein
MPLASNASSPSTPHLEVHAKDGGGVAAQLVDDADDVTHLEAIILSGGHRVRIRGVATAA